VAALGRNGCSQPIENLLKRMPLGFNGHGALRALVHGDLLGRPMLSLLAFREASGLARELPACGAVSIRRVFIAVSGGGSGDGAPVRRVPEALLQRL